MNLSLRLTLEDKTAVFCKQGRPWVEKYPSVEAPVGRTSFEGWFLKVLSRSSVEVNTPRLLGLIEEDQILVLEDLGSTNDGMGLYADSKPQWFADALNYLAKLHAIDVSAMVPPQDNNLAMRELNAFHMYQFPFQDSGRAFVAENFPDLVSLHETVLSRVSGVKTVEDLSALYLGKTSSSSCLLHGDFYPGSWIYDLDQKFFCIDPEFGFVGPKEFDLGVYIAHAAFCGWSVDSEKDLSSYLNVHPDTDLDLAHKFACIEVLRRIYGLAQLPLQADVDQKAAWTDWALGWI
jgi:5-methylthioribose kinase